MGTNSARCAIYVRISLDKQGEERGVGRQLDDCRELVGRHPTWEVVGEFKDNDISATSGKRRPGYERLMAAVGRGEVDVIVVYMLSRLWRNRAERADAMAKLAAVKGRVVTVQGPDVDLSTATGRMLLDLMGAFDTFEVEVKGERHRRAALESAEMGAYHGPFRPFGYQIDYTTDPAGRKLRTLVPDPVESELVKELARRVLDSESLRAIGLDWTARGVQAPRGGKWAHNALRQLLLSVRYVGLREHDPGRKSGPASAAATRYPASWPAILDQETFDAVGEILRDPARSFGPADGHARVNLLAGFLRCGRCGARLVGHRNVKPYALNRRYGCPPPPRGCAGISRGAADVEHEVERRVFHWLEDNGLYDQARMSVDTDEVRAMRRRRRELTAGLDRFADYLADGTWDRRQYERQIRKTNSELDQLDRQLARHVGAQFMDTIPERGSEFMTKWERAAADGQRGLEWRRKVIGALIDRVVVHTAFGGRAPFDPNRLQVFPGPWAAMLTNPDDAQPAPVPELPPLTQPALAFLAEHPDHPFNVYEVADALGRSVYGVRRWLDQLVADGAALRVDGPPSGRHGGGGRPKTLYQIASIEETA